MNIQPHITSFSTNQNVQFLYLPLEIILNKQYLISAINSCSSAADLSSKWFLTLESDWENCCTLMVVLSFCIKSGVEAPVTSLFAILRLNKLSQLIKMLIVIYTLFINTCLNIQPTTGLQ